MKVINYIKKMSPEAFARFLAAEPWISAACKERCMSNPKRYSGLQCSECYKEWLGSEYTGSLKSKEVDV